MKPLYSTDSSICPNTFDINHHVSVSLMINGTQHKTTCESCVDGVVQRGSITKLGYSEDPNVTTLPWNAGSTVVKDHLKLTTGHSVLVERTVINKYGSCEWKITFIGNPGNTPPGSGDVYTLSVLQETDTTGYVNNVALYEVIKGSVGLSGSFSIDYGAPFGQRTVSATESDSRLESKLNEMSTIGVVHVKRECFPSCSEGGWGSVAANGSRGGYKWKIFFTMNPGISNAFSFPLGSGNINIPNIDFTNLLGEDVIMNIGAHVDGSLPLFGSFLLSFGNETTTPIPYNSDAVTFEQSLTDLSNAGLVKV